MTPLPHDDSYDPSADEAIALYETHPRGARIDDGNVVGPRFDDDLPDDRQPPPD